MSTASDSLKKFIRYVTRDTTYHKHYGCTVQGQSGQTVDLLPNDPDMRGSGLNGVPIYNGLPGVTAQVAPGSDAILFYEDGDPTKPRAKIVSEKHISVSFNDGLMPIARVDECDMKRHFTIFDDHFHNTSTSAQTNRIHRA